MPSTKKKGGRPPKYNSEQERKAAKNASRLKSYHNRRQQVQQPQGSGALLVQFDARSIPQRAGLEGSAEMTAPNQGIQAEELNIATDEEQQQRSVDEDQQGFLQVFTWLRFHSSKTLRVLIREDIQACHILFRISQLSSL